MCVVLPFQIGPVCIQDPFVLNHNTASNMNDKTKCRILHEFNQAWAKISSPRFSAPTAAAAGTNTAAAAATSAESSHTEEEWGLCYVLSEEDLITAADEMAGNFGEYSLTIPLSGLSLNVKPEDIPWEERLRAGCTKAEALVCRVLTELMAIDCTEHHSDNVSVTTEGSHTDQAGTEETSQCVEEGSSQEFAHKVQEKDKLEIEDVPNPDESDHMDLADPDTVDSEVQGCEKHPETSKSTGSSDRPGLEALLAKVTDQSSDDVVKQKAMDTEGESSLSKDGASAPVPMEEFEDPAVLYIGPAMSSATMTATATNRTANEDGLKTPPAKLPPRKRSSPDLVSPSSMATLQEKDLKRHKCDGNGRDIIAEFASKMAAAGGPEQPRLPLQGDDLVLKQTQLWAALRLNEPEPDAENAGIDHDTMTEIVTADSSPKMEVVKEYRCGSRHRMWLGRRKSKRRITVEKNLTSKAQTAQGNWDIEMETTKRLLSLKDPAINSDKILFSFGLTILRQTTNEPAIQLVMHPYSGIKDFASFYTYLRTMVDKVMQKFILQGLL